MYDRYKARQEFRQRFNLTDELYSKLAKLWYIFGNNGEKHTPAGHYFIQEIIEHNMIDYLGWKDNLHPDLIAIVKSDYPQLMCVNKEYSDRYYNK